MMTSREKRLTAAALLAAVLLLRGLTARHEFLALRATLVGRSFAAHFVPGLVEAAAVARCREGRPGRLVTPPELVLWGLFFLVHALLVVTYGLTPHDVNWHLGTSIDRLLVFPVLLLVMLVCAAVERALGFRELDVEL